MRWTLAKQKGLYGIGVDADQSFLGPHILTSATKKVNVAVYNAIKEYNANPSGFKTGFNQNYTVKNGGVGYGKLSPKLPKPVAKAYTRQHERAREADRERQGQGSLRGVAEHRPSGVGARPRPLSIPVRTD